MSTFESSSSSAAPAAVRSVSSRTTAQRKTLNHNALSILPTPSYRQYVEASAAMDSDEEEERIRIAFAPQVPVPVHADADEYYPAQRGHHTRGSTAVNFTIHFRTLDSIRDAFVSAKKRHANTISALLILVLFFALVVFGGSVASGSGGDSRLSSLSTTTPSGLSTRIMPIWSPEFARAHGVPAPSRPEAPPTSVGRAARAAFTTQRPAASAPPAEKRGDANVNVVVENLAAPSGTVSAKFRLLYVYAQAQEQGKGPQEKREHSHPDNLAKLFGNGSGSA